MTNTTAYLEDLPEWQLALDSGASSRQLIELAAGIVREHRGEFLQAPDAPGAIPARLTAAERKAIRVPLGRYAAARAAGYDDARARDHADGQWDTRITTDRAQADRTAAAEGLVWIPSQRGARYPVASASVSIIVLDAQTGRAVGWWYLPNIAAVLQALL